LVGGLQLWHDIIIEDETELVKVVRSY